MDRPEQLWVRRGTKERLYRIKGVTPRKSLLDIVDDAVAKHEASFGLNEKKKKGPIFPKW